MDPEDSVVVELVLQARDQARAILAGVDNQLKGIAASAEGARLAMGGIGLGVAAGVGAFFVEGVRGAEQYQKSLTQLQVNSKLTAAQAAAVGAAIDATARSTTTSGASMVAALGPVAGELEKVTGRNLNAADATKVLAAAQNLVESSGGNLRTSTKTLTDLLLVYGQKADGAAKISDLLFQAHARLGIGTDRLGMMLQRLQPRITGSGVDLQHLLGIVDEMSKATGGGQRAIMMVGNILQTLQNPSKGAAAAMHALGISVTDASGKFIGFEPLVQKLHDAYNGLSTAAEKSALMHALFGRQANIALALITGGRKGIEDATKAMASYGSAGDAAEKMAQTLGGQLEHLRSRLEDVSRVVGMVLVNALQSVLRVILPVIDAVTSFAEANPQLVAGVLAAAGAIGALVANTLILQPLLGLVGTSIAAIGGPILLFIGGITALFLLMQRSPSAFRPLINLWNELLSIMGTVGDAVGRVIAAVQALIEGRGSFKDLGAAVTSLLDIFGEVASHLITIAEKMVGDLLDAIGRAAPGIIAALGVIGTAIIAWGVNVLAPTLISAFTNAVTRLIDFVGPLILPVLGGIAAFVATNAPVVIGAFIQLGINALGALGDAIVHHADRIIAAIGALFALTTVIAAVNAAGMAIGAVWSLGFKVGAMAADAFVNFIPNVVKFLLRQVGLMTAAGVAEGGAVATGVAEGAAASEALAGVVPEMAGVIAADAPVIAAAGTTLGGALAAAVGAAFALALPALIVATVSAAVIAAGAFLSNFIKSSTPNLEGVSSWADYAGRAQAGVPPPGGWRPKVNADTPSENAAIARAAAAVAAGIHSAGGGAARARPGAGFSTAAGDTYSERAGAAASVTTVKHVVTHNLTAAQIEKQIRDAFTAAQRHAFDIATGLTPKPKGGAGAGAGGVSTAAASLAGGAATLEAAKEAAARADIQRQIRAVQSQIAATPKTDVTLRAQEAQHLQQLRNEYQLLVATQGLQHARTSLTAAEKAVEVAHEKLKLAQEGRIKGVHAIANAEAAYKASLEKLTAAQMKTTLAEQNLADVKKAQADAAAAQATMNIPIGTTGEIIPVGSKEAVSAASTAVSAAGGAAVSYGQSTVTVDAAATIVAAIHDGSIAIVNAITGRNSIGAPSTASAAPVTAGPLRPGGFYGTIKVYLDGKEVHGTISKILFEEERQYAGPVNPLTGF